MAPCAAGENEVALSDAGYAANVEIATGTPPDAAVPAAARRCRSRSRLRTRARSRRSRGCSGSSPPSLIKSLPVVCDDGGLRLALVRGDDRLNEIKLRNVLGQGFRPATEDEITQRVRRPAGIHRAGGRRRRGDRRLLARAGHLRLRGQQRRASTCAASSRGATSGPTFADIRTVRDGDICPLGGMIEIEPAIEVGNIFKLGTRYSEPLEATYLDEDGRERPIVMGSYGIGPARIAAAAVEQYADEQGISWPRSIAPFDVHLVGLGKPESAEAQYADRLYESLVGAGIEVLYDDRDISPGREVRGGGAARAARCASSPASAALESGRLEVQVRRGHASARDVPLEDAAGDLIVAAGRAALMSGMGRARTLRPAPPGGPGRADPLRRAAAAADAAQPGRLRAGSSRSAVFVVVAFSSDDGRETLSTVCFCIATWGDYLDGLLARLTGQYSRLGALMDPLLDRLVVIAGVAVVLALRAAAALGDRRAAGARGRDGGRRVARACAWGWTSRSTGPAGWRCGPRCRPSAWR